jgi:radical SAM-linked protein
VKLRVRYSKLGKVRFTSHRDGARLWERALRKADVPIAVSGGFTPRPKLSFGLALPTGAESLAEYLDLELATEVDIEPLAQRLTEALPPGFTVSHVVPKHAGAASLQEDVVASTWRLTIEGRAAADVDGAVATLLASDQVWLDRERKGERCRDDVRGAVDLLARAASADDDPRPVVTATLSTAGRGLRPGELLAALFPQSDPLDVAGRMLRTHQWTTRDGVRQEIIPASDPAASTAHALEVCA